MAEVIKHAARNRQGPSLTDGAAGQQLLEAWSTNFSRCRHVLESHEIETIILDAPDGKSPGPDGVPAAVLKRYV